METKLDKKTKILFILMLVLIVVSIAFTYSRALITKDFEAFYDDYGEEEELMAEEEVLIEEEAVVEEETVIEEETI